MANSSGIAYDDAYAHELAHIICMSTSAISARLVSIQQFTCTAHGLVLGSKHT